MKIFHSIVIPMYNSEKTIKRTLDSICKQTYKGIIETVIVDDGSVDNSISIVKKYIKKRSCENRIFILETQSNQGPSSARNKAITLSKGEYISLLDSDDLFDQNKIEIIDKYFSKFPNIDVIGHSYSILNRRLSTTKINLNNISIKRVTFIQLLIKNFAATPCVTFKKSCNVFFDQNMKFAEDHDFFLRMSYQNCNLIYLNEPLSYLNREILSDGGLSQNKVKMRIGEIKMYLKLYKLNKIFIVLIGPLILLSILKHIIKLGIK